MFEDGKLNEVIATIGGKTGYREEPNGKRMLEKGIYLGVDDYSGRKRRSYH